MEQEAHCYPAGGSGCCAHDVGRSGTGWVCLDGGHSVGMADRVLPLQNWLRLYGYLPQPNRHMSTLRSAQILASALSEMQRFYGIPVTGVLDEETKA